MPCLIFSYQVYLKKFLPMENKELNKKIRHIAMRHRRLVTVFILETQT